LINLVLTVLIIVTFDTKPRDYPTLTQQYYRSKMYEPHLDVKYLLQYKEFKVYALISAFLLAAVNTAISLPQAFLFVEAQSKMFVYDILTIWCPLLQIIATIGSAFVIVFFGQTNKSYKIYFMALIALLVVSNILGLISFVTRSAGFFAFCMIILQTVCGALRLFIYEFVTELIFPVSPCFGLAIMHALSGLLSLLINMLAADVMRTNALNETFPCYIYVICALISGVALYFVKREPYKLNRSDYDYGRRSTMVSTYTSGKKKPAVDRFNVGGD
jgi:hypothetical protein